MRGGGACPQECVSFITRNYYCAAEYILTDYAARMRYYHYCIGGLS